MSTGFELLETVFGDALGVGFKGIGLVFFLGQLDFELEFKIFYWFFAFLVGDFDFQVLVFLVFADAI